MDRVAALQCLRVKRRHVNTPGIQNLQSFLEPLEISRVCEENQVNIFANLRRAVEHASLPAHKQRLDAIRPDRRKDLSDRGRDQGCLPWPGTERKSSRSAGT